MGTRKLLADSVLDITQLNNNQLSSDAATAAFTSLRKGVAHAASSRTETLESLLGDSEFKGDVLRFLVEFYMQRRIFRKQVAGVVDELLSVNSWLLTLKEDKILSDTLPDELARLLAEKQERRVKSLEECIPSAFPKLTSHSQSLSKEPPSAQQASTTPQKASRAEEFAAPSETQEFSLKALGKAAARSAEQAGLGLRRQRLAAACMLKDVALPSAGSIVLSRQQQDVLYGLLEHGRAQMESLGFTAADKDQAIPAFETFRRAVQQAVSSKQDENALEKLETKGKILDFLVDMYERHQKYRSRVTSTLTRLLNFDSWNRAADGMEEPVKTSSQELAFGSAAGAGAHKWTPWGPVARSATASAKRAPNPRNPFSVPAASASAGTMPRPRQHNPFASDVAAKQTGHPAGAFGIWKDQPTSICTPPMAFRTPMVPGPRGPSTREAKPTNPFSPAMRREAPAAATNPFKRDLRSPSPKASTPKVRDPFFGDLQFPAFVPNARC